MFRSRLNSALLISLLLHAALGLWLALHPAAPQPESSPLASEAVTLTWVDVEAETPPSPQRSAPKKDTRQRVRPARREPASEPAAPAAGEMTDDVPLAGGDDSPLAAHSGQGAPPSLLPKLELAPEGSFPAHSGRGHTLYPDDPSLSPEVARAVEEKRVRERVGGMMSETLAEARAQRGLPHPYFSGVREALTSGLETEARAQKLGTSLTTVLQKFADHYVDSAESYAKTGNPNLGPPGTTPRQSERLMQRIGQDQDKLGVRGLAQAVETMDDLKLGKPLFTLTLELRQARESGTASALVLKGSGNSHFDQFVLDVWPKAVEQAGRPPADAFHGPELRSVWAVEGWLRLPKDLERALSYLPRPGVLGVSPLDRIAASLSEEGYRYEFRTRLLRTY
jgi:hypothetical protein